MNPDAEITVEARVGHERHIEEDGIDETARLFDPCRRERGLLLHRGMLSMVRSDFAQETPIRRAISAYSARKTGKYRVDQLDKRLLDIVQENAELTSEALSALVPLSPSAVQRRLARLKKDGVISRTVALVDPKAVGRVLTILVEIEIQTEHRQGLDQFQRWLQGADEVQSGWYVTGSSDYVLLVSVKDLEEYNQFIERLMTENPIVRRYTSLVVLRTVKSGFKIKVD